MARDRKGGYGCHGVSSARSSPCCWSSAWGMLVVMGGGSSGLAAASTC